MPAKVEALGTLFFLLPGFVSAYISQRLAVRRERSELDKVVQALIFSFLLYLATMPAFSYSLPLSWRSDLTGSYLIFANYRFLLVLLALSIILGVLHAANINHDWLLWCLRWAKITERTARSSIWNDTFQEIGGFVQIGFKDGKRLIGWVRYYSDDSDDCSVFLEQAAWVNDDDQREWIKGPGILLTKESAIESVSFLSWDLKDNDSTSASQLIP